MIRYRKVHPTIFPALQKHKIKIHTHTHTTTKKVDEKWKKSRHASNFYRTKGSRRRPVFWMILFFLEFSNSEKKIFFFWKNKYLFFLYFIFVFNPRQIVVTVKIASAQLLDRLPGCRLPELYLYINVCVTPFMTDSTWLARGFFGKCVSSPSVGVVVLLFPPPFFFFFFLADGFPFPGW